MTKLHGTTVLSVRRGDDVALGADGQVTVGDTILKAGAVKVRDMLDGKVLCGFAGATADALALFERLEEQLKKYPGNMPKAAVELAKTWRTDKMLRQLDALIAAVNREHSYLITGAGDVLEPDDGIIAMGSGGPYAMAAARVLLKHTDLSAAEICRESLLASAGIDLYTNDKLTILELK
ncbi:MAG: ATP-dependent protease subunit HslV [Candidatus Zixiibacteriota bacterium]|jgi:ATP-dependent HslUV protease subunit HslV